MSLVVNKGFTTSFFDLEGNVGSDATQKPNRGDVQRELKNFSINRGWCFSTQLLRRNLDSRSNNQCDIHPQWVWHRRSTESTANWQRHWFTPSPRERNLERPDFPQFGHRGDERTR